MGVTRRLPPLPNAADLLRLYRIKAQKQLSQNFILSPTILDRFAKAAGEPFGREGLSGKVTLSLTCLQLAIKRNYYCIQLHCRSLWKLGQGREVSQDLSWRAERRRCTSLRRTSASCRRSASCRKPPGARSRSTWVTSSTTTFPVSGPFIFHIVL